MAVQTRIKEAIHQRPSLELPVRLVAVSKTKSASALLEAYAAGQRVFGENYVQELCEKAKHPELSELRDLEYHFIGKLQSNKVNMLINNVPQLCMVETVSSSKLARKLDAAVGKATEGGLRGPGPLSVMIQVNSSGELQKGGVESIDEATTLAQMICGDPSQSDPGGCANLKLAGLMTIGNADYSAGPDNFTLLAEYRRAVAGALSVEEASLELSMGMSGDFPMAIEYGATNVRVGSTIFGDRVYDK